MIQVIRSAERYHFENNWLSTYWHFSFDHYYDPANVSFGPLRVFNDDVIRPGGGFPQHGHREMEIVTYIIEGQLEHRDDLGNVGVISPGEIQRMSAGTGVRHAEYNASKQQAVHLLQLWILPAVEHLKPSWEQQRFSLDARAGKLLAVAVPADPDTPPPSGAVRIHQNATIYASRLHPAPAAQGTPGESVTHALGPGRRAYVFLMAQPGNAARRRPGPHHRRARIAACRPAGKRRRPGRRRLPSPRPALIRRDSAAASGLALILSGIRFPRAF